MCQCSISKSTAVSRVGEHYSANEQILKAQTDRERQSQMPKPDTDHFDREINVFCRYLIGRSPDEYVVSRYHRAHEMGALSLGERGSRFDELLLRIARISPAFTRMADAYASVCQEPRLRSKLVLLLAILETSPAHSEYINAPPRQSRLSFLVGACGMVIVYLANVLAAALVLLPLHVACRLRGNHRMSSS